MNCSPPSSSVYGILQARVLQWGAIGWVPYNWCFWTAVLEYTLESLLGGKEIKPVNNKGNQPWMFIGRTDAEAPIVWPPDAKSQLSGKDPDAGKDWGQEEIGRWRMRCLDGITDSMERNLSKLWDIVDDRKDWHAAVYGVAKSQTRLSGWTTVMFGTGWGSTFIILDTNVQFKNH